MAKKGGKAAQRARAKKSADRTQGLAQASAEKQAIRSEVQGRSGDQAWGTSPGALGAVKAASEEARMGTCFECGYSGGRHAGMCSRGK